MCGINLMLNAKTGGEENIVKMMNATFHRGPDHPVSLKVAPGIFIAGNQPRLANDDDVFLVWDGALYNHQELRNQLLDRGLVFTGRSDTEILIHWLRRYGEEGVKDLQGMFAFAYVDKQRKIIIVARDAYGQKSLYYHQHAEQWLFSSEARGITASGLIKKGIDTSQYLPFFYSRHSFPDQSFFEGVKQLLPGRVMTLDFSGRLMSELSLESKPESVELPTLSQFREMVLDAVLKNFQADDPVGIILSGGVDSSLLLHLWYEETGIPLHTFTAIFASEYQGNHDDAKYAARIARKYRCAHHEVLITPEVLLRHWEEYIATLDQPIGDSASFLTWYIAREARTQVKVLISGAGADELFSGYDRHRAFKFYLRHPGMLYAFSGQKYLLDFLPRRLRKFIRAIADSPEKTYLNFSSLQAIPVGLKDHFLRYFPKASSPYKAALYWDQQYYLVNDILKIHDNATKAQGLEGRAPYMDKALVTLSHNMTEEQHLSLDAKQWMKGILKEEGWDEIASRRKQGFGLPLQAWFKSNLIFKERVFSAIKKFELASGTDFPEDMLKLARDPEKYKEKSFLQLWNVFVLASWQEKQGL